MTGEKKTSRVLVVDDEPDIRTVVGLNLRLAGMEFGEAKDGDEALEMLETGEWDACLLDLMMPGTDGYGVLRELRSSGLLEEIAVIVLSAKGTPAAAMSALELGAHSYLIKPFSAAAISQTIGELIGLSPEERAERRNESIRRAGDLERLGVPIV